MNKKMKNTSILLIVFVLILMTACSKKTTDKNVTQNKQEPAAVTSEQVAEQKGTQVSGEETEKGQDTESGQIQDTSIPYWTEDSAAMKSILEYVKSVTTEGSDTFVPEEDRIVVFDFDGTLFGELFPTYFDECFLMHRVLHDETYQAPEDMKTALQIMEDVYTKGLPEPENAPSTSKCLATIFKGMTLEEYQACVRDFMSVPAYGFKGMTYGQGFYKPMTALLEYLAGHNFKIFISSGTERACVRELTKGVLDSWVPSDRIIGSTFSLTASGQGEEDGKNYTLKADDEILFEGEVTDKNVKTNKVFSTINEIGKTPILVFGNSSGDLALGQYTIQNGGRGYMLLCDDTDRDYGKLETAEKFAKDCAGIGLETISMKKDFATIYGDDVIKVKETQKEEPLEPAA